MNASVELERPASTGAERPHVEVDPGILSVIKSASAPIGVPKNVVPPRSIPGSSNPLTGLRVLFDMMRRGIEAQLAYRAEHGDIYRISMAGTEMVGVWDADAVAQILKNDDRAWSTGMGWAKLMFEGLDERGNVGGLLAVDFEDHRVARKLVAPAFTTKAIDGYLRVAASRFATANRDWVERGHVDFKAAIRVLLSQVANEIFTGITDPAEVAVLDRALADAWYVQFAIVRNAWLSPTFRRGQKGMRTLLDKLRELVPIRRASGGVDLLSHLCAVTDRDDLTDDDIVRIFVNIIGAAFDTTTAGITNMAYLLAKYPDWQERIREEAFAVGEGPLDSVGSRKMTQCDLFWKETLRYFPVATFVPRRTLRTVDLAGHTLPAGTFAVVSTGSMGRHPAWWNEPDKFDPERFLPERAEDKKHPAIYQPFGSGPHVCIGMQLATMEVKAYWHDLLRRARVRLDKPYEARHTAAPMGIVSGDVRLRLEPLRS